MNRTLERRSQRDLTRFSEAIVTDWLNGKISEGFEDPEGISVGLNLETKQRIRRVLDLVLTIRKFPRRERDRWDMPVVKELNEILADYPKVFSCRMGGFGLPEYFRVPRDQSFDEDEACAVESILDLAHGGLEHLRQCRCKTWYFARKSDQKSCSQACRKAKHEQTPEYKARKAARAKTNYHIRKALPIR